MIGITLDYIAFIVVEQVGSYIGIETGSKNISKLGSEIVNKVGSKLVAKILYWPS